MSYQEIDWNTITAEDLKEVYRKIGIPPTYGCFFNWERITNDDIELLACCPIAATIIQDMQEAGVEITYKTTKEKRLPDCYFDAGFDDGVRVAKTNTEPISPEDAIAEYVGNLITGNMENNESYINGFKIGVQFVNDGLL